MKTLHGALFRFFFTLFLLHFEVSTSTYSINMKISPVIVLDKRRQK